MRLLLVEDDSMIGAAAQQGLRGEGHTVDWVRDGREAEAAATAGAYDAVLLDLGLPRKDGLSILKAWRVRGLTVPVVIITARDAVSDRVAGLDAGADDYLVKPFDYRELEARVRALLRRNAGAATNELICGDIIIDRTSRTVAVDGVPVELTRRELTLLEILAERPGRIFGKDELVDRLFGFQDDPSSNAVEQYIARLRKRLSGSKVEIRTLRGLGYQVVCP